MAEIKITSMANGWSVEPRPVKACMTDETHVARTPKELSALVEKWATEAGLPTEKREKAKS